MQLFSTPLSLSRERKYYRKAFNKNNIKESNYIGRIPWRCSMLATTMKKFKPILFNRKKEEGKKFGRVERTKKHYHPFNHLVSHTSFFSPYIQYLSTKLEHATLAIVVTLCSVSHASFWVELNMHHNISFKTELCAFLLDLFWPRTDERRHNLNSPSFTEFPTHHQRKRSQRRLLAYETSDETSSPSQACFSNCG